MTSHPFTGPIARSAALLVAAPLLVLSSPTSSSATTTCTYKTNDYQETERQCTIDKQIRGGKLEGGAYWTYEKETSGPNPNGQTGGAFLTLTDLRSDGKCANIKLALRSAKYPSVNQTEWVDACGKGTRSSATPSFNAANQPSLRAPSSDARRGAVRGGAYSIYLCVARKHCVQVWKQGVNQADPTR